MSLIEIEQDNTPAAVKLAKGFTAEANQNFETIRDSAYDAVQRFWFRNGGTLGVDESDQPLPENIEPTGLEIMQALGTNAARVYAAATRRAEMVIAIANDLDRLDLIEMARIAGPYTLTFSQDGSLDTWTRR